MIEIKASEDAKPVSTGGPHDHEGTRAIATGIDEAVRLLNYATMPGNGGLAYPSDVYTVLGALSAAMGKLPQALQQMAEFIGGQVEQGQVRENPSYGPHGGDVDAAFGDLATNVMAAAETASLLGGHLDKAQAATRGLEIADTGP